MQHFRKKLIRCLSIILLFLPAGCRKWVTVPAPVTQVTADGVFRNDAAATAAVQGLYSQIMGSNLSLLNGATSVYCALSADDLSLLTTSDPSAAEFAGNTLSSRNPVIATNLWAKRYSALYQINACLEGIRNGKGIAKATADRLTGQLLFMRALLYFYLVNLFGDVPLQLTTDYSQNAAQPRSTAPDVYEQIITDLRESSSLLSDEAVPGATEPTGMAALALLSRVYLYQGNWAAAEATAGSVIDSHIFSLAPEPASVFLPGSPEIIFGLLPVIPGVNTSEALNFIPSSGTLPRHIISNHLLFSFEEDDKRKKEWTDSLPADSGFVYIPYKYKAAGSTDGTEYNVVLRLAEQYLIRAEARAEQDNTTGAAEDIDVIRQRAGLPLLPLGLTRQDCLDTLVAENFHEFFAEWGHRWLDLKRTGNAASRLAPLKSGWQNSDTLYPIPFSQIQINANLTQNPGY